MTTFKNITDADLRLKGSAQLSSQEKGKVNGWAVLLFICTLVSFLSAGYLFFSLKTERTHVKALASSKVQWEGTNKRLQEEVNRSSADLKQSRDRAEAIQKELDAVKADLLTKTEQLTEIQTNVGQLKKEKETLSQTVKDLTSELAKANAKAVQAASIPLGGALNPNAEPKVMTVNRQHQFVVINLGSQQGVQPGSRYDVIRDGKKQGSLEVEKPYEHFSAAKIINEPNNAPIVEGDLIQQA